MHIDRNTGIIEMFMEKLQDEDEGTYTFQIQDGKATGHSTLVLIGDGKNSEGQSGNTWLTYFDVNTSWLKRDPVTGIWNCLVNPESNYKI